MKLTSAFASSIASLIRFAQHLFVEIDLKKIIWSLDFLSLICFEATLTLKSRGE